MGTAKRFTWHAQSAAARLGFTGNENDALAYWLDLIRKDAPEPYIHRQFFGRADGGELASIEILDICGLSSDYCRKCETQELISKAGAPKSAPAKPPADRPILTLAQQQRLADAEKNLLLVKGTVPGPRGKVVVVKESVKS